MLYFDVLKPDHVDHIITPGVFEEIRYYDYGDMGKCIMKDRHFSSFSISESQGYNNTKETVYLDVPFDRDSINSCFLVNSTGNIRSVHAGKIDFIIDNNHYNLGYYPNTISRNYTPPEAEIHLFHLSYHKNHLHSLLETEDRWKKIFLSQLEKENFYMAFKKGVALTREMQHIIFDLRHPVLKGEDGNRFIETRVLDLLTLHIEMAKKMMNIDASPQGITTKDQQILKEIRIFLSNHYSNPDLSLSMLCREFGINEFKLKKGFKALYNTSVFGYIMGLKMKEAYRLLADKAMNITEVSDHLGYSHPGHFTKAFKKQYQVLPSSLK